jgi:50S ribosomal subunit-associated GTPase HflX
MIIVGNKADLVEPGSASILQVEKLAAEYQVPFQITSAKTGENVENAFVLLAQQFQFNNG